MDIMSFNNSHLFGSSPYDLIEVEYISKRSACFV